MEINPTMIERILVILYAGCLAMVGQIATLIHNHLEGKVTSIRRRIMSLILAFVIGRIVKDFIPFDNAFRDSMLIISGAIAGPIWIMIEKLGVKVWKKILDK